MSTQKFGAGIWHFATYVDRYATDGYGPPRSLIEMIDLGYMHYVLQWLGPLGGVLFRRGMYKRYYVSAKR